MDFCIVFCEKCGSRLVDSGFSSPSNLRCCECGNIEKFKVGKVRIDTQTINVNEIIRQAEQDARI